MESTAQ
jgi:hypothetical protein